MKILFMIPKLSYSGAPKIMAWIANKMCEFEHEVHIITIYESEQQQLLNNNIKLKQFKYKQSNNWFYRNTLGMIGIIKKYRKYVKQYKPDVIVSFLDSISYFYIFLNHIFWHDKILVSERADPYSRRNWSSKIRFKIMEMCDYVVFQTEQAKNFFGNKYDNKSSVIANPIILNDSLKNAILRREADNFKRKKNITFVGRLSIKQKRQDIAIKAFIELKKVYSDYKLCIYGTGKDEQIIKDIINNYELNNDVILMGQQNDIPEKIVDSTCFIITSDFEGIPNALIEAMSIGLPCVSTDFSPGGAKLLIDNNDNGFIAEKGDYIEIANKMKWIIENPNDAEAIGKKAMKVSEKFSEKNIAKMWEEAIISVK